MTDGVTVELKLSGEKRRQVQKRAEELRENKIESLRQGYGDRQADKVDSAMGELNEAEYLSYLVTRDLRENGYLED